MLAFNQPLSERHFWVDPNRQGPANVQTLEMGKKRDNEKPLWGPQTHGGGIDSTGVFGDRWCTGAALSPQGLQALGEGEEKATPWASCCSKQAMLRFYLEELSSSNL